MESLKITFRLTGPLAARVLALATERGSSASLVAKALVVDALQQAHHHEVLAAMEAMQGDVRALHRALATSVEAILLNRDARLSPEAVARFVSEHLRRRP